MRAMLLLLLLTFASQIGAETTIDPGQPLFEGYCATCHQLPDPQMLNGRQWKMVMLTMQKRMQQANMTPLSDEEFQLILNYLQQARDD